MALVDRVVADRLALEVVRDRPDLQAVLLEQRELALHVARRRPSATGRGGRPSRRSRGRRSPSSEASCATSSSGRSAHWPVKRVTGRAIAVSLRSWARCRFSRSRSRRCRPRELRSTASSTRCTCRPSANDGRGCVPVGDRRRRSPRPGGRSRARSRACARRATRRRVRVLGLGHQDLAEALLGRRERSRRRTAAR